MEKADVGIVIGAGTDVAVGSADVVLIKDDPRDVSKLISLSSRTMRKMNEKSGLGNRLQRCGNPGSRWYTCSLRDSFEPEFATITMSASSISMVINALLMKRAKI